MSSPKWFLTAKDKTRLAIVLFVVAVLLLLVNKYENDQVADIDQSYLSIYEDRLVPATAIYKIRENLYAKEGLVRELVSKENTNTRQLRADIALCNAEIGKLLSDYRQTYFLEPETNLLLEFEAELARYNLAEAQILLQVADGNARSAQTAFHQDASVHFKNALQKLSGLNDIQSAIGKDMLAESKKNVAGFRMLINLESGLVLLFGLIAYLLIIARAVIRHRVEPFNMN